MSNMETLTSKTFEDILQAQTPDGEEPKSPPPIRCTPDLVQDLPLVDNTSDSSPVGSYKESSQMTASPPPVSPVIETPLNAVAGSQSAAETFANSDGTIVRIKSNTELQRPAPGAKFITASFTKPRELSSFKRSLSTNSPTSPKEETATSLSEQSKSIGKVATVTGNAIQVKAPSIPTHLDLVENKTTVSVSSAKVIESEASKSLPTTPAGQSNSSFPPMSMSTDSPLGHTETLPASGPQKFKKPPPPVKAKPKPPAPPPKPKK